MPSSTKAQAHFMSAVAHGWKPTGEKGPSRAVAEEFHQADKKQGKWEHARKYPGMGEHHEGGHQHGHPGRMEKLKGKAHTSAERSHKHRHGKDGRF